VYIGELGSDVIRKVDTSGIITTIASGTVRCWGWGLFGQLGYGNTNDIGDDEYPTVAGPVPLP